MMGDLCSRQERYVEAAAFYVRAVQWSRESMGPESRLTLQFIMEYGSCLTKQDGKHFSVWKNVVMWVMRTINYPNRPVNFHNRYLVRYYARMLSHGNEETQALQVQRHVYDFYSANFGEDHKETLLQAHIFGCYLLDTGSLTAAGP